MGSRAEAAGVDAAAVAGVEAAGVAAEPVEEVVDPAEAEAHDLAAAPDLPAVADRAAAPDRVVGAPGRVVAPDPVVAIVPAPGPVVAEIVHPPSASRAEGGAASATVVASAVAARMSVAREVPEVLVAEGALAIVLILVVQVAWVEEVALEAPEASVGEVVSAVGARMSVARVASEHQAALAADLRLAADRTSPLCLLTDLTLEEEAASARIWARLALEPWVVRWAAAWRIEWAIAPRPVCQDWATIGLVLVPSGTGETVSTIV
jgi:hypothetical protein